MTVDVEPLHGGKWRAYEAWLVRRGDDGWDEQRTGWYGPVRDSEQQARMDAAERIRETT